jgi:hypothetical protein
MEDSALGAYNIAVSIIGHNTEGKAVVLQLPNGVLVNAVVSKTLFEKHIKPLIENPPKQDATPPPAEKPVAKEPVKVEAKTEPEKMEDLWYDPMMMFDDIRGHARGSGCAIVPDERPGTGRLAWRCKNTGKTWSVELSCIKEALDNLAASSKPSDQSMAINLRKCVYTIEGRERLCASFNAFG